LSNKQRQLIEDR